MDTIYIKLKVRKTDIEAEEIRDQALLFIYIAEALFLDRDAVEEIDESNYLAAIKAIKKKFSNWGI